MEKKYPSIKINVSAGEKARIEQKAKSAGISVSAYVKKKLDDDLNGDFISVPSNMHHGKRENKINVYFSDDEYAQVKKNANTKSLPSYVRDTAVKGTNTIEIQVYDDDIVSLEHTIVPKINKIFDITQALIVQNQLHDVQAEKMLSTLSSISDDIKTLIVTVRGNRTMLRNERLRELRRNTKTALHTGESLYAPSHYGESDFYDYQED